MQTIKTAIVVVLLLGVCYGAYVALNAPEPVLPPELEAWDPNAELMVEDGQAVSIDIPQLADHGAELGTLAPPNLAAFPAANNALSGSAKQMSGSAKQAGGSMTLPDLPPMRGFDEAALNSLSQSSSSAIPPSKPVLNGLAAAESSGEQSNARGLNNQTLPDLALPKVVGNTEVDGVSVPLKPAGEGLPPIPSSLASASSGEGTFAELPGFPTGDQAGTKLPTLSLPASGGVPPEAGQSSNLSALPVPGSLGQTPAATPVATPAAKMSGESSAAAGKPTQPFRSAREEALKLAGEGKLREALVKLTPYYNHIELTREEQADLNELLDALAREVIYSKRHLIAPAFHVGPGETLEGIANRFKVSPETLASINMLGDSKVVLTGSQLKVLNGPFRADVNLTRGELTLFLEDMYAGRFPISVGKEPLPMEGSFQVVDRRRDRTYYGANSQVLPATDPRNPYGGYWMSLGQDLCIHGSPANAAVELANAGCISLAPLDAREVYSLVTLGSQVTIHR